MHIYKDKKTKNCCYFEFHAKATIRHLIHFFVLLFKLILNPLIVYNNWSYIL